MCSSAPDTSGINAAAKANADVAQEALRWYEGAYADQAPDRAAASARANAVSDAQLTAMRTATGIANKDQAYREGVFQPLERSIVNEAQNYDTLDRRDKAAGEAVGEVQQAEAAQRAISGRDLARMGVNPSDGAYGSMERAVDTSAALGSVQAANTARDKVRTVGQAMKFDAANLGRGIASSQATQASLALNAGNSSVANAGVPLTIAQQGIDQVGRGYGTFINANNSAGNLYGTIANIQNGTDSANAGVMGGVGSAIGGIAVAI